MVMDSPVILTNFDEEAESTPKRSEMENLSKMWKEKKRREGGKKFNFNSFMKNGTIQEK